MQSQGSYSPSSTTTISTTTTTSASATSTTATTSTKTNKFLELRINNLFSFCENRHQVPGLGSVVGCEEGVAGASVPLPTSSTNSMNIVLAVIGVVIIDHKLHIIDVETSSSNIRSYQNRSAPCLKLP